MNPSELKWSSVATSMRTVAPGDHQRHLLKMIVVWHNCHYHAGCLATTS